MFCTFGPLLKNFPKTELSALHEAFPSPKNLFSGKFRPLNQHILGICYCVMRKLQPERHLTASSTGNTLSCRRSHPTPSPGFFCCCFLNMVLPIPTAEEGEVFAHTSGWDLNPSCPWTRSCTWSQPQLGREGLAQLGVLQELHCQQHPWASVTHGVTAQLRAQPSWVAALGHLLRMLQTPARGTKLPSTV